MRGGIDWAVSDRGACGVLAEIIVVFPIRDWTNRPGNEAAAAIRTNVLEHTFHAVRAECAFITAYPRLE